MFTVYPAIDLRGGKCVRLRQGDYDRESVYGDDPVEMAKRWEREGAEWLHLVDLDGARTGDPVNLSIIEETVRAIDIPIQVGGGIRSRERIDHLLDVGVERVILGSAAIEDVSLVRQALAEYGDRIVIGIDARDGYVATHGWLETSEVKAEELAQQFVKAGAELFIFTDISRDGMLSGPNIEAIRHLASVGGGRVIASGGVGRLEDVTRLAACASDGIAGVIVGRALYTGDVILREALQAVEAC